MPALPNTQIGETKVSRLLCGSNPFFGYSYRSPAHDAWQRRVMTVERIAQLLEKCLECGITGLVGNYDEDDTLYEALELCEERVGSRPHWIAFTHGAATDQIDIIDRLADQGAFAIYIQGGTVDSLFEYSYVGSVMMDREDGFDAVVPWLERIRDHGCVPGLCSHHPQIIQQAEAREYGAEFYVTPLNYVGVYCDYAGAVATINQVEKPFIGMKTLGGSGKIGPREGFTCAYTALKRTDAVAVGVENEESIEYDAQVAADIMGWLDGKVM